MFLIDKLSRDAVLTRQAGINLYAFSMWERRGVIYEKSGNQELGLRQ